MARRSAPARTTSETALPIRGNINISGEQGIVPQSAKAHLVRVGAWGKVVDSFARQGTRRFAAADQARCEICVHLVDQGLCEERGVDFCATFDQEAQHAALAQLIEQGWEAHPAVGASGQAKHLGRAYTTWLRRGDESVGADYPGRLADS